MKNPESTSHRKFFLRFGLFVMTFAALCLLLAAFAPQPSAAAQREKTPTATEGPSPTPEPPNYCGDIHVNVNFYGITFVNGKPKPVFEVIFRDDRDSDCDGIPDGWDNCPQDVNKDQARSDPDVSYGDACQPESGNRLTNKASEVVIYQMSDGAFHFYSPEGEKLGELWSGGFVAINPTLVVKQLVGRTFLIGYTNSAGQFRSTTFQSNALTYSVLDIDLVAVSPPNMEVKAGQSTQFFANGFDGSGIELWFIPRWSATGGSITRGGVYTAGSKPGAYAVTACRISGVCGSAQVTVVQ